jgi:hypothetical protein
MPKPVMRHGWSGSHIRHVLAIMLSRDLAYMENGKLVRNVAG